jgi:hypothetical protein
MDDERRPSYSDDGLMRVADSHKDSTRISRAGILFSLSGSVLVLSLVKIVSHPLGYDNASPYLS